MSSSWCPESSVTVSLCSYLTRLLTVRTDLVTSLCQGAGAAPDLASATGLRCATHRPRQSSFLRLCPHLTETLSLAPAIILIHQFVSEEGETVR